MSRSTTENAYAVLLPAFATTELSDSVRHLLANGGCSILVGETRDEYVAREVSKERKNEETARTFSHLTVEAAQLAGEVLVALDQEIGGICRLHGLTPALPANDQLSDMKTEDFERIAAATAAAARQLGVNCFLAPILDIVTGENPWLSGRTWSTDPNTVARISSAYIRGIQSAGVAATAKHFPGFHHIDLDPAIEPDAMVAESSDSFEPGFIPFAKAIESGVESVMIGPAIVEAFDRDKAASISPRVIGMLRQRFGFKGVVMSDDLDSRATLRGRTVPQVAVDALNAGADFLLVADVDDQLGQVACALCKAVENGGLDESRLADAAARVRTLVKRYNCQETSI